MKKILSVFVILVCFAGGQLIAEETAASTPIGFSIGTELAMEANFSKFGLGHWLDYYKSLGILDIEGYFQFNPYYSPASSGGMYFEANAFLNIELSPGLLLIPSLSSQSSYDLSASPIGYAYTLEPGLKLDAGIFFIKAAVPVLIGSPAVVSSYLEPGIKVGDFKLKLRGDIGYEPLAFTKLKWYAEKGAGPFVVYAYGVITGFQTTLSYSQYLGVSFAF